MSIACRFAVRGLTAPPFRLAQVQKSMPRIFLQAIVQYGQRARWLRVLQCMLAVHGQPLTRNQTLVLSLVLQERDRVLNLTGACPATGRSRARLIEEEEHAAAGVRSVLRYHAACVQLLADCCRGRNAGSQHKCRALLSPLAVLETVLALHRADGADCPDDVVSTAGVRYVCQPFLSFFLHVYAGNRDFQPDVAVQQLLWTEPVCLLTACTASIEALVASPEVWPRVAICRGRSGKAVTRRACAHRRERRWVGGGRRVGAAQRT